MARRGFSMVMALWAVLFVSLVSVVGYQMIQGFQWRSTHSWHWAQVEQTAWSAANVMATLVVDEVFALHPSQRRAALDTLGDGRFSDGDGGRWERLVTLDEESQFHAAVWVEALDDDYGRLVIAAAAAHSSQLPASATDTQIRQLLHRQGAYKNDPYAVRHAVEMVVWDGQFTP
ncbi:hypothetical protein [Desulfurispira natronophila]|uniref:Uncharacterized protein n=1 Tax=Desulfurispira natronophila TaxID=682562 RepID=A0A7W7Y4Y3_9BACT|nr:hypothetical protein [Desulfurispira natronophila]MBB5022166.1 hypothetical protein [Desulfurispira natronophila]